MSEQRRMRAEGRLEALQAEYEVALRAALRRCADGVWGLFGQNAPAPGVPPCADAEALAELGAAIEAARMALGYGPFALHARYQALCGRQDEQQPGEPKVARAFLQELGS